MTTKEKIILQTTILFSQSGYEAFSIRTLAETIPLAPSVLYHYFVDKDALLTAMFHSLNTSLGKKREQLPKTKSAQEMLRQRIIFQIDNAQAIVAVLKYYLAYRNNFPKNKEGYVPDKSALHMEEVLRYGVETGEFSSPDMQKDAKVMTHAINGFLLEYYPVIPKGKEKNILVENIYQFLIRAIMKGGEK